MVMFLFVIAYLGGRADAPWAAGHRVVRIGAIVACLAIAGEVMAVVALEASDALSSPAKITSAFGSPATIGELFLTDHLLAFEITSIILLVAAVGGVILGSGARTTDVAVEQPPAAPEPAPEEAVV
jgi:NADH:ubiquinone oxidoreductase subunit 6 (subunit J)